MTLTRDRHLSEELTQDAFCRAFTSRSGFRSDSDAFTWLCAIAKNLYADELRRRKRFDELPQDIASGADMELDLADKEQVFRIHTLLHGLAEPYREVFELRVFGELSFRQIGTVFGKTESWARVTYHRARLQLQERMEDNT